MKPSHLKTPRVLADCTFVTGYSRLEHPDIPTGEVWAGRLLAVVIGAALALVFVYGGR